MDVFLLDGTPRELNKYIVHMVMASLNVLRMRCNSVASITYPDQ